MTRRVPKGRVTRSPKRRPKRSQKSRATQRRLTRPRAALGTLAVIAAVGAGLVLVGGGSDAVAASQGPIIWTDGRVRVEVANGGGVARMARAATGVLREAGFDVVDF